MIRSFIAAVIPAAAFARNDNDGSSQANAKTVELLNTENYTVIVHTYNAENGGVN